MKIEELLRSIDGEVSGAAGGRFTVEVTNTDFVPSFDDTALTYLNIDQKVIRCKLLESCVLYVDIRDSAQISVDRDPETLSRLYAIFIRSMVLAARQFGGHVRNIIGDRVMVVFDRENCFTNAVNTAALMNTICSRIINKHYKSIGFKAGIGIDYGKMLVTKTGAMRQGGEREFYRSLVWLGKPANIASRLTDVANKFSHSETPLIVEGLHYLPSGQWEWNDRTYEEFADSLERTFTQTLRHKNKNFATFFKWNRIDFTSYPPIMVTEAVMRGYRSANPEATASQGWNRQKVSIPEYNGEVWGSNLIYTVIERL